MKRESKCEFGYQYEDEITGFQGTCTGVTFYDDGTTMIQLVPRLDKDGHIRANQWIPEHRLKHIDASRRSGF